MSNRKNKEKYDAKPPFQQRVADYDKRFKPPMKHKKLKIFLAICSLEALAIAVYLLLIKG